MNYRQEYIAEFAKKVMALGFKVYLAKNGEYGFITDDKEQRVLCFQNGLGMITLSGNYKASRESGTGWRIENGVGDISSVTAKDVKDWLYASAPHWANKNPQYTTVKEHLKVYGESSGYTEVKNG